MEQTTRGGSEQAMNRQQRRAALKSGEAETDLAAAERVFGQALERQRAGRLADAAGLYRKAVRLAPGQAEIHYNLGVVLMQMGHPEQAADAWKTALAVRPGYPKALNNLGLALGDLDRLDEAEAVLREAVGGPAEFPETHNNLAIVLRGKGLLGQAETHCRRALVMRPDYADACNSLGIALFEQGRPDEAARAYRRAVALEPAFAKAHFNLALVLLQLGELTEGWAEHEWRWRGGARHLRQRKLAGSEWQGEPLDGRRILLHAEQGFGDGMQFVRFAGILAGRGGRVILEVPRALVRLCRTLAGPVDVVAAGDRLPAFDVHLPLMSVPRVLGTTLATIPVQVPYLSADPGAVSEWATRLAGLPGIKVGLVWSGDPRPHDPKANIIDRRRSMRLVRMAPLLAVHGASFVSLQKGIPAAQLAEVPDTLRPTDAAAAIDDFADTAAVVANLDLVITVDTAVAHLAGAMAKPVWVLSRFDGCWRWLRERSDSPWYPTARLFRQSVPGVWDDVIADVADRLAGLTRSR
jgi:Flp pilus assembly protein TadD